MNPLSLKLVRVTASLVLLGCALSAEEPSEWGSAKCDVPKLLATSDWIEFSGRSFRLLTPPKFGPAIEQPRYVHGGHLLTDGTRLLEVTYGAWAPISFGETGVEFCHMAAREQRVIVVRRTRTSGQTQLLAIFPGRDPSVVSTDDPLVAMAVNDDAEVALFYTIVSTASRLEHP
jgi:hypothetical protein